MASRLFVLGGKVHRRANKRAAKRKRGKRGKVVGSFGDPRKIARARFGPTLRQRSDESAWQFRLRQAIADRERAARLNPAQPGEGPGQNIRNGLAVLQALRSQLPKGRGLNADEVADVWAAIGDVIQRLNVALRQVESGRSGNPTLAVFGNPGKAAGILSNDVQAVLYRHATDGKDYVHPFGNGVRVVNKRDGSTVVRAAVSARSGVRATLLRDGSVLLRHPTKPLWGDF